MCSYNMEQNFMKMASSFFILITLTSFVHITVGLESYRKLNTFDHLSSEMYYIDKSELLRIFFNEDNSTTYSDRSQTTLDTTFCYITCPRGFGKTTNLKMIQSFAQIELDSRGNPKPFSETLAYHLFENLKIYKYSHIVARHMARYPVLYMDMSGFARHNSCNIDHVRIEILNQLANSLDPYSSFKNDIRVYSNVENSTSLRLSRRTIQFVQNLLARNLTTHQVRRSLLETSQSLYEYFNRTKVILLIDQFDDSALKSPLLESSYITESYRELISIISELFVDTNSTFAYIRNVVIAGVSSLPYSAVDVSILDNLKHYAFLDDHIFSQYFGLNHTDMSGLFTVYGISSEEQKAIINYYNAYWLASSRLDNRTKLIYNTNSIMRYIINRSYTQKRPYPVKIFWPDDELQGCISRFLRHPQFRQHVLGVLKNGRLEFAISKRQPGNAIEILERFRDGDYRDENQNLTGILLTYYFEIGYLSHTLCPNVYTVPNIEIRKTLKKEARIYVADHTVTDQ